MQNFKLTDNKRSIQLDVSELDPQQIRLIRTINTLLKHIAVIEDEEHFFEGCAEIIKQIAAFTKQSSFSKDTKNDAIPYAEQALEYALDSIRDRLFCEKLNTYDN